MHSKVKPVDASKPSEGNAEPQQATDSTHSQSPKPNAWRSPTMLSEAEIESLRQETRRDMARIKELIAASKLNAPKGWMVCPRETPNRLYSVVAVEFNEKSPAAQWVAASANADVIDLTSTRSAGDWIILVREDVARTVGEEASQDEYHAATQEALRAAIVQAGRPTGQGDTGRARAGNQDGSGTAEQAGREGGQR